MRRTIARSVTREGHGVHSGAPSGCRLHPAPSGTGLVFQIGTQLLPALLRHVRASQQRTVLSDAAGNARVETIEYLLSACYGMGVDDLRIEVWGGELPILDGSALPWCAALLEAGLCPQPGERDVLRVPKAIEIGDARSWARLVPGSGLVLDLTVDFPDPAIGVQHLHWAHDPDAFVREIAPARTFGNLSDQDRLRAAGLGQGASLENTIVFDRGRVINLEGLRFADEPVRHKALDVLGDLALLGAHLEGHLRMMRPGHALTAALMGQILAMTGG